MAELPFNPGSLGPSDLALYSRMVERRKAQGANFGGPYAALMNHPKLCERLDGLGYFLKFQGRLPREVYQFVVLCVARKCGAAFEWVDHVEHAKAEGVPSSIISGLQRDGNLKEITIEPYSLAAKVLSATLYWNNIPQAVQAEAILQFGVEGFVELVVLSGFYQMFSAINQGFGVTLPKGAADPFS